MPDPIDFQDPEAPEPNDVGGPHDVTPGGELLSSEEPSLLESSPDHRSGYVALVGKPNAGKSTLLNALIGQKLSIVSKRPQTTRHRVLGILSGDDYQVIFLDTPGVIKPRYRLQEAMMHSVDEAIQEADLLLFLADVTDPTVARFALERIGDRPALLVLNKMDLIRQEDALQLVKQYTERRQFDEVIPISALKGRNLDLLRSEILRRVPLGPPFYPKDLVSEHPERFFISEMIREKIFEQFREEIPYSTQVNVVQYEERPGDKDFIDAEIVVERPTQKGILIGKGGQALKRIGTAARADIEAFIGRPVFLRLFVKVREDWRNRDTFLRSYGYRT